MTTSRFSAIRRSRLSCTTSPRHCACTRSAVRPSSSTILAASPDTRLRGELEAVPDSLYMPCIPYSQRGWFQAIEPLRTLDGGLGICYNKATAFKIVKLAIEIAYLLCFRFQ